MLKPMETYGIGQTPLLELPSVNSNHIFLKMESRNFLGSVKARTAYALVKGLKVPKDRVIVESTSGNLGLALDYFCKEEGHPFLCLLDETVVPAKRDYLKKRGVQCEVVRTEVGLDGRTSRMKRAETLTSAGTHFWVNQYDNEDGVLVHQETTGPEILKQTLGTVTYVFSAVGSGGTISGIGEYFKASGLTVKIIGVEPYGSTIFHTADAPYITAGAGLRGKPGNIARHSEVVDDAVSICDEASKIKFRELNTLHNLDVGLTTGMAYAAAEQFCQKMSGETVVVIAADGMEFYHDYL
jgi:cysteine synthase A